MNVSADAHDFPKLWLMRHGETEWSKKHKYTGLTDLELTDEGVQQAVAAGRKLSGVNFDSVLTSPLKRARRTAELAGFPDAEVVPYAHEWDYGDYEGQRSSDIRKKDPSYLIWTHGVVCGETLQQVSDRADHVIAKVLDTPDAVPFSGSNPDSVASSKPRNILLVAHGHFLRVLAARWLQLEPIEGRRFVMETAAVCNLGWDKKTPAVTGWNI
jgi:broad specificity phosphatase PhoE